MYEVGVDEVEVDEVVEAVAVEEGEMAEVDVDMESEVVSVAGEAEELGEVDEVVDVVDVDEMVERKKQCQDSGQLNTYDPRSGVGGILYSLSKLEARTRRPGTMDARDQDLRGQGQETRRPGLLPGGSRFRLRG